MRIETYTDLVDALGNSRWVVRPTPETERQIFIQLAEAELNRMLYVREMEATVEYAVSSGSQAMPADYLAHVSLYVMGGPKPMQVEFVAPDVFDALRPMVGSPCNFTIVGEEMLFWPAPAEEVTLRMRYRQTLPALSETQSTNWLLTKYPDVYLFAALAEAADYVADPAKLQQYIARRDRAVSMVNMVDKKKITQRRRVRPSSAVA